MRRYATAVLSALLALLIAGCATTGKKKGLEVRPDLKMTIKDYVNFHNVSITWDGVSYYTLNGGNEEYGVINRYDMDGDLIESSEVLLDGRTLWWDELLEGFYVKVYGYDLMWYDGGEPEIEDYDVFFHENSSPAFPPDGEYIFELAEGTVTVYDGLFLIDEYEFDDVKCGEDLFAYAIAASDRYLFTWDEEGNVYVYDHGGEYVTSFEIPKVGFGLSLSWCNDMLWVGEDADASTDGGTGTWYGFELIGLP
jgi:hypothetical protein